MMDQNAMRPAGAIVQRLQLLEDREAIRSLLERYIDFNETRDYRGYSQLFASTGELQTRRGSARRIARTAA